MSLTANSISGPPRTRTAPADWIARAHLLLLIAYLLFTFIGTQPLGLPTPEERVSGNILDRLAAPAMTALALALIWARRDAAWACLRGNILLIGVVAFSMASILWSDYPDLTLRRALLMLFLTLISLGVAVSQDDLRLFHTRLFRLMTFVMIVNLAVTVLAPDQAITDIGVAGIYRQKNPAGMVAMIAVTICVTYAFGARNIAETLQGLGGAALSLLFLLLTTSKTSVGLTFVALGVGFLFWLANWLGPRFALLAICGLILLLSAFVALVATSDFDGQKILAALVSDPTFTGRDQLWGFAWRSSLQNPWLGHGYGAFWDVGATNDPLAKLEPGTWLGDVAVGVINQAHNGYLELCLHIGLPMTALAVAAIISALSAATRRAVTTREGAGVQAAYAMIALVLLLHLLHNFTEATLMIRGAPFNNLVMMLCFLTARAPATQRIARHGG